MDEEGGGGKRKGARVELGMMGAHSILMCRPVLKLLGLYGRSMFDSGGGHIRHKVETVDDCKRAVPGSVVMSP